jgi:uncharacterized phage-associated protein
MLVTREREKMFNALIYFSKNVINPGKTKLFKLLNFLDYSHFEKTGRSVTGLEYFAWKMGPVPKELDREWKHPTPEFISHNYKQKVPVGSFTRETLQPRHAFDSKLFSKYELMLMEKLAKKHYMDNAENMSELSHFKTGYWEEVWNSGEGSGKHIPYELVLQRKNTDSDKVVMERHKEDLEIRNNYG